MQAFGIAWAVPLTAVFAMRCTRFSFLVCDHKARPSLRHRRADAGCDGVMNVDQNGQNKHTKTRVNRRCCCAALAGRCVILLVVEYCCPARARSNLEVFCSKSHESIRVRSRSSPVRLWFGRPIRRPYWRKRAFSIPDYECYSPDAPSDFWTALYRDTALLRPPHWAPPAVAVATMFRYTRYNSTPTQNAFQGCLYFIKIFKGRCTQR